jgi:hypothetical protein
MFSLFSLTEGGRRNLIGKSTFYVERAVDMAVELFVEYAGVIVAATALPTAPPGGAYR